MNAVGVIPARLASTRLPRKLLLAETGKTLLQATWENACRATSLSDVIIAADGPEIAAAAKAFGARCVLTGEHPSGADRSAEVARTHLPDADLLVNIQGDEPELDPAQIDLLVRAISDSGSEIATLGTPIRSRGELDSPNCVKIALGDDGRAIYFSRSPIPFVRDANIDELLAGETPWLLHLGVYAYRRDFLLRLTQLPPSRLEKLEKLEQLRALEAGAAIQVAIVEHRAVGIDTPEDYAQFVARQRRAA
ncbi:MAG: 3-deoxy-manno-octulosonate cytidylyltransferase [Planctomycetota bacterium]|nr:3-deoxy-manno-octulosonate cytidylyltransferase [Planctomycetota bacterium]